jgi:glycosyltransferase involved in cell wall biosynthesis
MKVVLTHPFCWPYVRRGTERCLDVLAHYLTRAGHEVTLVSTRPQMSVIERNGSGARILKRPFWTPLLGMAHLQPEHTFFFTAAREVRKLDAEVVHSCFYVDALAVSLIRRDRPFRTVLQLNGIAIPGVSCRRVPPEAWMLRRAIDRVDDFVVCSDFIRQLALQYYGRNPEVIVPPVELGDWPLGRGPADGRPTVLSVGDFNLRRKGVRALVSAFTILKRDVPTARLRLSGRISPETQAEITKDLPKEVLADIEILGLGEPGELPRLYQQASVMALPSMWEPSGTVLMESLASGTPVVIANHGGLPEMINPEVGVAFEPGSDGEEARNVQGLAEALYAGLALATKEGVREHCRSRAAEFSVDALGPMYEEIYSRR